MRVVIGEDEVLQRNGLRLQLEKAGFEVSGLAGDARTLVRLTAELLPDVMITDIRMPPELGDDGLRAALAVRRDHPSVSVMVLSHFLQRRYAVELVGEHPAGAGYLLKQRIIDIDTFCADLRRVAAGGTVLDPDVVKVMVARARRQDAAYGRLTVRQGEVLALMAVGRSNASIARSLSVTEKAVVRHVSNVYDALGLAASTEDHRRVLAVIAYLNR